MGGYHPHDKVSTLEQAHYVFTSKPTWHVSQSDIVERHPIVPQLDVHIENHHTPYICENNEWSASIGRKLGTKFIVRFITHEN